MHCVVCVAPNGGISQILTNEHFIHVFHTFRKHPAWREVYPQKYCMYQVNEKGGMSFSDFT